MKRHLPLFLLLVLLSCGRETNYVNVDEAFTKDLRQLQEYFHIPGIAAIVRKGDSTVYEKYLGYADLENKVPMDSLTIVPMASLTKMFAATLILMGGDESVFLDSATYEVLEEPINHYVTDKKIPDSIKVKHVLSHTSQGEVGRHFYYSSRYGWLTKVIEKKYGVPYVDAVKTNIIDRLGLKNTFLLVDSNQLAQENRKIAKPYFYEGETKPGFIDYGSSAASGIASTVRDIAKFGRGLTKEGGLLSSASGGEMFASRGAEGRYGYGIFSGEVLKEVSGLAGSGCTLGIWSV